jgi:hypothetical protein
MNVEQLAAAVIDACEEAGVEHMLTGAFATSVYGVPRSTSDVDVVVDAAWCGFRVRRIWSCRRFAGDARRISTTPEMYSPCRGSSASISRPFVPGACSMARQIA